MPDIREKVEEDRGLIKKIQLKIPGYAGYRRREDIRNADILLRNQVADQVKKVRSDLEGVRDDLAAAGKYQGLQPVGNLIFLLQATEGRVRHAEGGYSGISANIRVEEPELDKLYEYDYSMLTALDQCAAVIPMIRSAADPASFNTALKAFGDALKTFDQTFDQRMIIITGTNAR